MPHDHSDFDLRLEIPSTHADDFVSGANAHIILRDNFTSFRILHTSRLGLYSLALHLKSLVSGHEEPANALLGSYSFTPSPACLEATTPICCAFLKNLPWKCASECIGEDAEDQTTPTLVMMVGEQLDIPNE